MKSKVPAPETRKIDLTLMHLRPVRNLSTGRLSGLKEHLSVSYGVLRGAAHLVSDQLDRSLNSLSRSTPL